MADPCPGRVRQVACRAGIRRPRPSRLGQTQPVIEVNEVGTTLSRLLARVEAGEEVVISRSGRPIARLVPFAPPPPARRPGSWRGRVQLGGDFDAPLSDEETAAWGGERP